MRKSEILEKDHDRMLVLSQRMTPEERLTAFFHHSKLLHQLYQAGARYRAAASSPSKRRAKKR